VYYGQQHPLNVTVHAFRFQAYLPFPTFPCFGFESRPSSPHLIFRHLRYIVILIPPSSYGIFTMSLLMCPFHFLLHALQFSHCIRLLCHLHNVANVELFKVDPTIRHATSRPCSGQVSDQRGFQNAHGLLINPAPCPTLLITPPLLTLATLLPRWLLLLQLPRWSR